MAVFKSGSLISKASSINPSAKMGKVLQWGLDARRAVILYRRLKAGQIDLPDMPWPFYNEPDAPVDKNIKKLREQLESVSPEKRVEAGEPITPDILNKDRVIVNDAVWLVD